MASSVATPLESQIATIAGVQSLSSSNTQGGTTITVQFDLSRNIDAATQDVQAAVSRASLPANMPHPPVVQKTNPSQLPVMFLTLASETLPMYTVTEYAQTMLAQRISMVNGIASVQVFGAQKYAVRIQVDPETLAAHGIGIDEVQRAVQQSNTNLPTGRLQGDKQ